VKQTPIQKAVEIVGGQSALATALGIKNPAIVWQWVNKVRPVPAKYCVDIERLTKGVVTREQLCPDFPWDRAAA